MKVSFIDFMLAVFRKTIDIEVYDYAKLDDEDRAKYNVKEGQVLAVLKDRYIKVYDSKEQLVKDALSGKPIDFGNVKVRLVRLG